MSKHTRKKDWRGTEHKPQTHYKAIALNEQKQYYIILTRCACDIRQYIRCYGPSLVYPLRGMGCYWLHQ